MHAGDFHRILLHRLAIADQRPFRRGAAHVERQQVGEGEGASVMGAHKSAGGRTRFERAYRKAPGGVRCQRAAARPHDVQPALEPGAAKAVLQALEVTVEHRLRVCVDRRRRPALKLTHVRKHVGRSRDGDAGRRSLQEFGGALLVAGIGIGMQEAHGHRLHAHGHEPEAGGRDSVLV